MNRFNFNAWMKILALGLGCLFALSSQAGVQVGDFTIRGLEKYVGSTLSLYYVSGRPAGLGTFGQEIHVNRVMKGPIMYKIGSDGMIEVQQTKVPRSGWTSFNYVIFVVHEQKTHALTNPVYESGVVTREPVRYYDSELQIDYSRKNMEFEYKNFKSARDISSGGALDL